MSGSDRLDGGLRAAFGPVPEPEGSVLARLDPGGRLSSRVVLLRDEADAKSPVTGRAAGTEGRYQILGEVARGGVGVVLKSRDVDLGRDVAMKVLRDEHVEDDGVVQRFIEEAQIGAQLQHPGIVPVYELGVRADRRPYFTMKLIRGRTLASLLSERTDLVQDRRRFLSIFEAVCQTMAYAHARGIIHRDLKPANVMVGTYGEVLVVDWGIGKVLTQGGVADERKAKQVAQDLSVIATVRSEGTGSESLVGSVMGTPRYMPPEQARGEIERLDERADVFGLGAILCEILTGKPPYAAADERDALLQAARGDLADATRRIERCGAAAELLQLAKSCLAPAAPARPKHAGAVAREIGAYLASVEERAKAARTAAAEARVKAEEERKRRKLSIALSAAVVATVVLCGAAWFAAERGRRQRAEEASRAADHAIEEATLLRGKAAAGTDLGAWREVVSAARRADAIARSGA
ncbi:MAG: serine/threonine protein kinase, partial [Planctomycetes bacterium]|nr:serine/threonine protein kinase [Planctomycetota bacterium]